MGKLINYIAMLVVLDLLFLITGQLAIDSNLSLIVGAMIDPANVDISTLFKSLFIDGGLALIVLGSTAIAGLVTRTDNLIYVGIAITLSTLLIGDFVSIFNTLKDYNVILAVVVMSPVIVLFTFVMLEWARGKD